MRTDETPGTAIAKEHKLKGIGVSPGIAIGLAYIGDRGELPVSESRIDEPQIEHERARFAEAVSTSIKQLRKLKTRAMALPGSAADEIGSVLDAHLAMLANSRLIRGVNRRIGRSRINAERAIQLELEEIGAAFSTMEDDYLAARIDDIRVVGARLILNLSKKPYVAYSSLSGGAIILAEEVTPADTALMDPRRIGGFATEYGGREGHTAIMARALGLPAVLGIPGLLDHARAEAPVIVDGTEGAVILDPAPETVRTYKARQQEVARERRLLNRLRRLPAVTRDGVEIELHANVELPVEVEQALATGGSSMCNWRRCSVPPPVGRFGSCCRWSRQSARSAALAKQWSRCRGGCGGAACASRMNCRRSVPWSKCRRRRWPPMHSRPKPISLRSARTTSCNTRWRSIAAMKQMPTFTIRRISLCFALSNLRSRRRQV